MTNAAEIIAPAASPSQIPRLVEEGASAIYAGPRAMSGRPSFTEQSMGALASARVITRGLGVRLYLAVNTPVPFGGERAARKKLAAMCDLEPDAFIVGSWDVYSLLRSLGARAPLHASSFMNVNNWQNAAHLRALGFARLILSTNLTFEEMQHILFHERQIEYEIIAHGGFCLNDAFRCGLPHAYPQGKEKPPGALPEMLYCFRRLEARDSRRKVQAKGRLLLNRMTDMSPHVPHLMELGIRCFKVEGRQRGLESVAHGVRALKAAVARQAEEAPAGQDAYQYMSPLYRRRPDRG